MELIKKQSKGSLLVFAILFGFLIGGGLNLTLTSNAEASPLCGTCMDMPYSPGSFCDLTKSGGGCDGHHTGAPCTENCGLN